MDQWINPSHLNKSVLQQVQLKSITYVVLNLGLIASKNLRVPQIGSLELAICPRSAKRRPPCPAGKAEVCSALSVVNSGNHL